VPEQPGVSEVRLTIPARPDFLALARLVVGAAASVGPSLDDGRIADLRLVVSEVCTNAMEANWRASAARLGEPVIQLTGKAANRVDAAVIEGAEAVRIRCTVALHEVVVAVTDRGTGFEPSADPHPPVTDPARLDFERGLGLPLIQFLADRVEFESASTGTTVTAVVRDRQP